MLPPAAFRNISLRSRSRCLQWCVLLAGTAVCMGVFNLLNLPAPSLLGAMVAAIGVALAEGTLQLPTPFPVGAQGIIGCLVASSFTPAILGVLRQDLLLFLVVTLATVLVSASVGWLLARNRILPGSTAIWGSSPGGAMVMTLMADRHGGDMRMVAVMQYSRVVLVTGVATAVAHYWAPDSAASAVAIWFPPLNAGPLFASLVIGLGGAFVSHRFNLPGGTLVWPMMLASVLQLNNLVHVELPPWLLAPTYAIMGWMIGLRFTRQALRETARALPAILLSILVLIALCAAVGTALTHLMGIDALTAYLATSPGGVDAMAIISTASGANVPFVMAFQTARLFAVLILGPALAQFATRRLFAGASPAKPESFRAPGRR